jgi:O-antigen/teichoic acid export membrane protein
MERYLAAIIEQGLWSLLNLGVNLGVARYLTPEEYGTFVFWTNLGFVLSSLQAALTTCHLWALAPGEGDAPHRLETERMMHVVTVLFLAAVIVISLVGAVVLAGPFEILAAPLFLASYLLQQYLRSLYFSRGKPWMATLQTALVLAIAFLLLGAGLVSGKPLQGEFVLACLAIAYGVVGLVWAVRGCASQMRGSWPHLRGYAAFAIQSSWIFLGVTTTELLARFYAFIVAAWYGPRDLAILAATQLLLRPVSLLGASWSMVARTDLASQREASQWGRFTTLVVGAVAAGMVIAVVWTALVGFGWRQIADHLFGGKYREYSWMVGLWGVSAALSFGQIVLNSALQVLREFKVLALANAAASAAAALAIVAIMWKFGYSGAIAGTATGQLLEMVVMGLLLAAAIRNAKTSGARPAPGARAF